MNRIVPSAVASRPLRRLKLDGWLLAWLCLLVMGGLAALYSASGGSADVVLFQASRLLFGFGLMLILAQTSPRFLAVTAPWVYGGVIVLLALVLLVGEAGGGAQRWLDFGIRFQPSEFAKLAVPLMLASLLRASGENSGIRKNSSGCGADRASGGPGGSPA